MAINIGKQIAALKRMTVTELRQKHIEAFGEVTGSGHKDYLVKRIAWRLQAQEAGDLSERARQRAKTLANDADLRTTAPKVTDDQNSAGITTQAINFRGVDHDPRLPLPGSILARRYKGRDIVVRVRSKGFEFDGEMYRSLSAVAKAITGTHWNGYHFFKLQSPAKNGVVDE